MTNPFKRKKHSALGSGLVIGSAIAGIAAYLFYSKNGSEIRNKLAYKIDNLRLKYFHKNNNEIHDAKTPDYLAHHQKAPKTDREKLLKHEILSDEHDNQNVDIQNS